MGSVIYFFEHSLTELFFGNNSRDYLDFIPFAILYMSITVQLNIATMWLRVQGWVTAFSLVAVFQSILAVVTALVLIHVGGGVKDFVILTVIADCILLVSLLVHRSVFFGWMKPHFSQIRSLIKYGLPLLPAAYAMWGLNWIDRLFLVEYTNMESIGIYSLIYGLSLMVVSLFGRPFRSMFPTQSATLFNNGDMEGLQRLFNQSAGMLLAFLIPATFGIALVGNEIILTMATPEFLPGSKLLAVVMAGYAINSLSSFYDVSLGLSYKQIWSSISLGVALILNCVLNALLIPKYGIDGAAWATLCSFCIKFLISFTVSQKFKIFKTDVFFVTKITLASLIMYICVLGLKGFFLELNGSILFGLTVYPVAGVMFYVVTLCIIWKRARIRIWGYLTNRSLV